MSTNAISNSQRGEGFIREPEISTLRKLNILALNIIFGILGLVGSMWLVANPEFCVLTNSSILYPASLLGQACCIFAAVHLGLTNFIKSYHNAKDLYHFWKKHDINKV